MGGVGFQQIFVLVFFYIAFRFQQQVRQENPNRLYQALLLLYVEYAALILITVGVLPFASHRQTNNTVLGPDYLSSDRVLKGSGQHDTKPRGLSIRLRHFAHAGCPGHL